jgi:hypothetical protein
LELRPAEAGAVIVGFVRFCDRSRRVRTDGKGAVVVHVETGIGNVDDEVGTFADGDRWRVEVGRSGIPELDARLGCRRVDSALIRACKIIACDGSAPLDNCRA